MGSELKVKKPSEVAVTQYDISVIPNDFTITTIFNLIDSGAVEMPVFQRNYVWDRKRASKFIESLILGLPVPQIFLYQKARNQFLVIDGQQRLLSIYSGNVIMQTSFSACLENSLNKRQGFNFRKKVLLMQK